MKSPPIPELLDLLDVAGCLVTIDAMGCQKDIAKKIHEKKGNYAFSLSNAITRGFCSDVELFLKHAEADKYQDLTTRTRTTVNKDHGRIEKREFPVGEPARRHCVERRETRMAWIDQCWNSDGHTPDPRHKITVETRLFITSISATQKGGIMRFARGHTKPLGHRKKQRALGPGHDLR